MKEIISISGKGVIITGVDIDTDRIIPARFLKETTFTNMGDYLFIDERFDTNKPPWGEQKWNTA